jgi:ABC-type uncharacterized transport system permease subunit
VHLIFFKVAAIFYLLASIVYVTFLLRSESSKCLSGFGFILAGLVAHTISIVHLFIAEGFFAMATGFDALSLFAWLVVAIHTTIQFRDPNPVLGSMAAPIARSPNRLCLSLKAGGCQSMCLLPSQATLFLQSWQWPAPCTFFRNAS